MKRALFLLVFIFALFQFSALSALNLSPQKDDTDWTLKSSGKYYRTYSRNKQDSDTQEVLLIGVVERNPGQVIAAITDYVHFSEFMPYVKYTKLVHTEQKSKDVFLNYVFTFLDVPIPAISSRFYNLRYTDVYNYTGNPEMFRSDWVLEKGAYRRLPTDPDIRSFLTSPENAVETTFNQGYFQIEPAGVPGKTRITYYVWTNPGGSLPAGAVNIANRIALPGLLDAIAKRASRY